jgi:hypothetical protein
MASSCNSGEWTNVGGFQIFLHDRELLEYLLKLSRYLGYANLGERSTSEPYIARTVGA